MTNINIDQLADSITSTLSKWSDEVENNIKQAVDESMKELVDTTKRDAPVRVPNGGDYKRSISSKVTISKDHEYQKTWFVKAPHYRLTHLLEKGHQKRGGGWVDARPHIGNNAERVKQQFELKVKEAIKNA